MNIIQTRLTVFWRALSTALRAISSGAQLVSRNARSSKRLHDLIGTIQCATPTISKHLHRVGRQRCACRRDGGDDHRQQTAAAEGAAKAARVARNERVAAGSWQAEGTLRCRLSSFNLSTHIQTPIAKTRPAAKPTNVAKPPRPRAPRKASAKAKSTVRDESRASRSKCAF